MVNVCSSSGKRPGQRNVSYSVSKAAELSLSRAYADAYARHGVLVNAVTPGPVASELWLDPAGWSTRRWRRAGARARRCCRRRPTASRAGSSATPQEIAAVIVFLCSEAASNVAGAAWSVDGGAVPVII